MRPAALVAGLTLLAMAPAAPAQVPDALAPGGTATVTAVVDGDTVRLDDGREVRLVGIQAPKLPLGRPNFTPWPLANEAKQVLESLVLGQQVALGYGGLRNDRHGRVLAHLFRLDNGVWIQRAMLAAGMARVYTFPDNRSMIAPMLEAERDARAAARGIWSLDFYAVRGVDALADAEDSFQLVEGVVSEVSEVGSRTYVNFGVDYRTDFTLVVDRDAMQAFASAPFALQDLAGRMVRARGWIDMYNGPMIDVTHPEQIELP